MFLNKYCLIREIHVAPIKDVKDGVSRTMTLVDKNGNSIELVFKGAEREHLLIKGLRD